MPSSPTKPGTRKRSSPAPRKPTSSKLSDVARKVVAPEGITSTAWPQVEATCRERLGVEFDPWQHGAGRLILAKRANGKFAAMIDGVGMSLPRQVGKTYLIGAMTFALCIDRPGLLVIWSAHHARTHGETFMAMQSFAERAKVKPYIDRVYTGSGDEEVRFANGSRILFGARERGFGRGVPGVDMIVSDEAQIMSEKALDDQLATMNTSKFGLSIYIGTPPRPSDPSDGFTRMRSEAWKGTLRDGAWIEFGAEPGCDPHDRKNWRVNPSYPRRTPAESILRLQRKLSPESFLREGLGVWDEFDESAFLSIGSWIACADDKADARSLPHPVFAVDVAPHHASASIVAVGMADRPVLELADQRPGASWVVARVRELVERYGGSIVLNSAGPVGSLIPELAATPFVDVRGADYTKACGLIVATVNERGLTHRGEPGFAAAVVGAKTRTSGDGFTWARTTSAVDITPLVAATVGLWATVAERAPLTDADLLETFH